MHHVTLEDARAAKAAALELFEGQSNVVGVGITKFGAGYAVKLNLSAPVGAGALPSHVRGVPLRVEVVGAISARV